jgi:hypothetical protein
MVVDCHQPLSARLKPLNMPDRFVFLQEKLVINAALGFDTFLVMRHGIRREESSSLADFTGSHSISGQKCRFRKIPPPPPGNISPVVWGKHMEKGIRNRGNVKE